MRRKENWNQEPARSGITASAKNRRLVGRLRVGIAVSLFNADVTERLLAAALDELTARGVARRRISIVRVPGSFELPYACQQLARTHHFDALIALGSVIKGETDHYRYVAGEASRGIMDVMLRHHIPIGFGVLTTDTFQQAKARSSSGSNKGAEAARAVIETLNALRP